MPNEELSLAQKVLAQSQAVIDRLKPLTTPFAAADADLREHLMVAWLDHIKALRDLHRSEESIQAADALIAHLHDAASEDWHWIAEAMHCKALAQCVLGDFDAALATWQLMQQRFEHSTSLPLREWLAKAGLETINVTVNRGATFARVDMVREADRLTKRFEGDAWPVTQVMVARIRLRQGQLLRELEYHQQAQEHLQQLESDLRGKDDIGLREIAADALHEQARLLAGQKRWPEAMQALESLKQQYAGSQHPGLRYSLALAHQDSIFWWHDARLEAPPGSTTTEETIHACEAMEAAFLGDDATPVLRCLSRCLHIHTMALRKLAEQSDDMEIAEQAEEKAQALAQSHWQRFAGHADADVRYSALLNQLDSLDEQAPEDSMPGYAEVLERLGQDTAPELQPLLARAWIDLATKQRFSGDQPAALATLNAFRDRFSSSQIPKVRLRLAQSLLQKARLLNAMEDPSGALALLQELDQETPPAADDELFQSWQHLLALGLQAQTITWRQQEPPEHPVQSGRDEAGERIQVTTTHAEIERQAAVQRLFDRFAQDPDVDIRRIVVEALFDLGGDQRALLHFEAAVQSYEQLLAQFAKETDPTIEARISSAYLNLAYLLMQLLERNEEAIKVYDALLAHFAQSTRPQSRDTVARANASRLTCLNRLQRQGVAVNYGDQYEDFSLEQRDALNAELDQARVQYKAGQHREAIAIYDSILSRHLESLHPGLRSICLDAMVNKGYCWGQLGQREAALATNNEIIARYSNDMNMSFDKDVALALSNKAVQLDKLGRHEEEIATYDEIIQRWSTSNVSYLRLRVARALWSKGLTVAESDLAQAEKLYRRVISQYLQAPEEDIRLEAAKAVVNLGALLRKAGRHAETVEAGEQGLKACADSSNKEIQEQVNKIRLQLARSYGQTKQPEQQLAMYQALLALPAGAFSASTESQLRTEWQALQPQGWRQKAASALVGMFNKR